MIRLTVVMEVEGQAPRAIAHESNARSLVLGRDTSADFQVPLSTISRQHARIFESDNVYFVEDLGSTHGTIINGRKLQLGEKKVLRDGDVIELTKAKITCNIESDKVAIAAPGEGTQAIAVKAVQGILGRLGEAQSEGPFFRMITGPDEGARMSLSGAMTEWSLGRSKDCEFFLNDPNVSRRHALVKKDWNGFTIQDLGSRNGVLINDVKIQKPRRLKDRDEIVIGPIKLIFIDPDADLLAALRDVPGFELDDSEELDQDPSVMGAPREEEHGAPEGEEALPDDEASSAEERPQAKVQGKASPPAPPSEEEPNIDPELLKEAKGRFPVEWVIIGSVGLLILGCVVLLVLILG